MLSVPRRAAAIAVGVALLLIPAAAQAANPTSP